jgi:hypothetical protein
MEMDINDLKTRWQQESDQNLTNNHKNMEQLQAIIEKKSAGTLGGVKQKYARIITFLLCGLLFNVLINPFLHFLLGDEGPVFRITEGGLLAIAVLLIAGLLVVLFYWTKYRSMDTSPDGDLAGNLRRNIRILKRDMLVESAFIVALFALVFVAARAGSAYLGHGAFWEIGKKDVMLALCAGIGVMGFYVWRRWRTLRQGVKELEGYLGELQ